MCFSQLSPCNFDNNAFVLHLLDSSMSTNVSGEEVLAGESVAVACSVAYFGNLSPSVALSRSNQFGDILPSVASNSVSTNLSRDGVSYANVSATMKVTTRTTVYCNGILNSSISIEETYSNIFVINVSCKYFMYHSTPSHAISWHYFSIKLVHTT